MSTLSQFFGSSGSSGSSVRSACIDSFGEGAYEVYYTDGTFTVPSGVTNIRVKVYGAGGASAWGHGGGGGGFSMGCISTSAGCSFSICVGEGGCEFFTDSHQGFICNQCHFRSSGNFCVAPTNSSFAGCFTATPGSNSDLARCNVCGLDDFCACGCPFRCINPGGSGSGGSVNYNGGPGACFIMSCSQCVCSLKYSTCGTATEGAIVGGGSAATQCGNGYPGFRFCRTFRCFMPGFFQTAVGGAGALCGNTWLLDCCRFTNLVSGCALGAEGCRVGRNCVADGWGAQDSLDTVKMDPSYSGDTFVAAMQTSVNGGMTYVNYDRGVRMWAERHSQNYDNPDVPVPGEYLTGHGGKTVTNASMRFCTRIKPSPATPCIACCASQFALGGSYNEHIEISAGHGGPGAGGGAAMARANFPFTTPPDAGCSGCCKAFIFNNVYQVSGGNGGFAGGGGGVMATLPSKTTCGGVGQCDTNADFHQVDTGRGGIGGGSGGFSGWCVITCTCCDVQNNGCFTINGKGGNGLVVVEY